MKLLHYLIPITLAACGNASSDEQPSGCQIDSDCKGSRICLESICEEAHVDATITDITIPDAGQISSYEGILFALAQKSRAHC